MKAKLLLLVPVFALTACAGAPAAKDPNINPQGLNTDQLIRAQIAKMEQMQREMEKRESEMKYQHLKELTQVQMQSKSPHTVNTNCKFFCF